MVNYKVMNTSKEMIALLRKIRLMELNKGKNEHEASYPSITKRIATDAKLVEAIVRKFEDDERQIIKTDKRLWR